LDEQQNFTAVFAASDSLAFGAAAACREYGLSVPEDISIVGFDDIDTAAYFNPPLTTVRQNRDAIGARAGELLADLAEGKEEGSPHIYLPAELIARGSVVKCSQNSFTNISAVSPP
jgi:DNA-binding LacI/PurR family transcriptional regulator